MNTRQNFNIDEINAFEATANDWWDPTGPYKPLHDINPTRVSYIERYATLKDRRVIDVGCGGGLLSEAIAQRGAHVTGLDLGEATLEIAREHAGRSELDISYLNATAEEVAQREPDKYDVVACLEVLEHVPDPEALVSACAQLARPGGYVFLSTLNRTARAWGLAIVGAEYVLKLIPKGTHHYRQFIKPSELARMALDNKLTVLDISGLHYSPVSRRCVLGGHIQVNYLMCCQAVA